MDFLTGPSNPAPTGPDFIPPGDDDLDPIDLPSTRIFSRAFVMLLGAVALVGVTVVAAYALTREKSPLLSAELGSLTEFVEHQDADSLTLDIYYGDTDDMDVTELTEAVNKMKQVDKDLPALLKELGFSASVKQRMGITRALDGTQEAETDDLKAYWTYHPDSGLNVVIEHRKN